MICCTIEIETVKQKGSHVRQFHTYNQAVYYLYNELPKTPRLVQDPQAKIEQNKRIMQVLGNPQDAHPSVHVAGTSGKGTICYLVDAILRAHTKHTGLLQSPHVYDIRERVQLNGQLVSERQFLEYLHIAIHAFQAENVQITFNELLTTMGFIAFGKSRLDYAIVEVGLGGRLDRTNCINRKDKLAVLGQIGFDHTETLGHTLREVAGEKAGIVQEHNRVVALLQEAEVVQRYEETLREKHASVQWVQQASDYQKTNNAVALQICQTLADRDGWILDMHRAIEAIESTFIPGRYEAREYKDHFIVLDGAHNPQKLTALAHRLDHENRIPATCIVSLKQKKELRECLQAIKPAAQRIIATEYFTQMEQAPFRPISANEIVAMCNELNIEAVAEPSPSRALALAATFSEPIVATGSFYILSEIDAAF
jgi:dihydrofolate synthase/folylpolyglutamate synthase